MACFLRNVVLAAAAGAGLIPAALVISAAVVSVALAPIASADAGPVVSPGMEIRQSGVMCTLGFVDPVARIASRPATATPAARSPTATAGSSAS